MLEFRNLRPRVDWRDYCAGNVFETKIALEQKTPLHSPKPATALSIALTKRLSIVEALPVWLVFSS